MVGMKSDKILYGLLLAVAFCVGACGFDPAVKTGSSENLLTAEGEWKLVEDARSPDPVQSHLETRDKVEPTKLEQSKVYTTSEADHHADSAISFRVLRLERQMKDLRSEFDLAVADRAFVQPRKTVDEVMEVVKKPKAATQSPMKMDAAAVARSGELQVTGVRVGEHPGKTRLVLDLSGPASKYTADLDNDEKILLVDLPATSWSGASSKVFSNSPVLKSYSAQSVEGGGTRLAIELKRAVKVSLSAAMKPNAVHGHRVVFDLSGI